MTRVIGVRILGIVELSEAEALALLKERQAAERADAHAAETYEYVTHEGRTYIVVPPAAPALASVAPLAVLPSPAVERAFYTTESRPPDIKSKDRFHRLCREMAGAKVPGIVKLGRGWKVTRTAWESYRAKADTPVEVDAGAVARMVAKLRAV